jgi:hypothetical protein
MQTPDATAALAPQRSARLDRWVTGLKDRLNQLPPPLRLATFVASRGIARIVVPRYRRTARMYAQVGRGEMIVSGGPFKGIGYIACATGSTTMPKLLGTYELELHDAVERVLAADPDVVVDVGSAEGYYAIGLAVRLPRAKVLCYDIDPYARYLLYRLGRRNGVLGRVIQKQACDPLELEAVIAPASRPVVIMDVDGPEDQLLRPELTPTLRRTRIILELHDLLNPGVSERIRERFSPTHKIESIDSRPRTLSDLPADVQLPEADALEAMGEARAGPQQWFVMTPKG